jgi:hypothetical protein
MNFRELIVKNRVKSQLSELKKNFLSAACRICFIPLLQSIVEIVKSFKSPA